MKVFYQRIAIAHQLIVFNSRQGGSYMAVANSPWIAAWSNTLSELRY